MKTVIKSLIVVLVAISMALSPALLGLAMAGSIHYEGYSGYKPNITRGYNDEHTRGLMFNFSYGGPKDYKQDSPWQDIYKQNLTRNEKTVGLILGAAGLFAVIWLMTDDDECVPINNLAASGFTPVIYNDVNNCRRGQTQIDPPTQP